MNELLELLIFFITFLGWICSFYGYGQFFANLIPESMQIIRYQTWNYGIIGMIVVCSISIIINFFSPLSFPISLTIMMIGIGTLIIKQPLIHSSRQIITYYCIIAIIIFIEMLYTWFPGYDTGLYHISAINWIISNPTPFGLANLHSRLGLNTAWFPLSACTEQIVFLFNRPVFLLNGILFFFYCSIIKDVFLRVLIIKNGFNLGTCFQKFLSAFNLIKISEWFLLLTILPFIYKSRDFLSNSFPDFPVFVFTLIIIANIIDLIEESVSHQDFRLWSTLILAIFTVTIKLSSITLLPLVLLFLIMYIIHKIPQFRWNTYTSWEELYRKLKSIPFFYIGLITALIVPFEIRGIILSGNLAFPAPFGVIKAIPWALTTEKCKDFANEVTRWARLPKPHALESTASLNWLSEWTFRFIIEQKLVLILTFISIITLCILWYGSHSDETQKKRNDTVIPIWYPVIIIIFGLFFWFINAPDPRFGLGYLYATPLIILSYPYLRIEPPYPRIFERMKVIITLFVILATIGYIGVFHVSFMKNDTILPGMPDVPYSANYSTNGEITYIPLQGDQAWNIPLPNTPYFNPNLSIGRNMKNEYYTGFLP